MTKELFVTCSARDRSCHKWIGRSDSTYEVTEAGAEIEPGSKVRLKLKEKALKEFNRLSVKEALFSYGFLLPVPIKGEGLGGYAYISKRPLGAGQNLPHRIYLRSMFFTEDGRELIPKWAGFARCIVDSDDLTPTASREGLQRDGKLIRAKADIEKCLLDYLTELTRYNIAKMKELAGIHNLSLKAFSLENSKVLKLLFPFLIFTTNKGNLTGAQILEVSKKRSVFYSIDVDIFRRTAPLLKYSKSLLVNAGYIYEADIFSELLKNNPKVPIKLFDDSFLEGLFENPDVDMERALEDFLLKANEELREKRCRAVVKRLSPPELPAFYVEGEGLSFELDLKAGLEYFSFLDGFDDFCGPAGGEQTSALYINCDNRLIRILRIHLPLKIPDYILWFVRPVSSMTRITGKARPPFWLYLKKFCPWQSKNRNGICILRPCASSFIMKQNLGIGCRQSCILRYSSRTPADI